MVETAADGVVDTTDRCELSEKFGEGMEGRDRHASGGSQVAVLANQDAAWSQKSAHLTERRFGLWKMQQQETAVNEIEGGEREAGAHGIRLNEQRVAETPLLRVCSCLIHLVLAVVDAHHLARRSNHGGQQPAHDPNAASEIGDAHSCPNARTLQQCPRARTVDSL